MRCVILFAGAAFFLAGCAVRPDYSLFERNKPRTVLVFPPLNDTASVDAPYKYFPTVTVPLAERGYYVIPIAVSDRMLKENGVIGPEEMRQVSRDKLREIFGADALLDATINDWGTSYWVVASSTVVSLTWRLMDLHTGQELWRSTQRAADDSGRSGGGFIGAIAGAVVHAVEGATSDKEVPLAENLNSTVFMNDGIGLLPGARWVEKPN